MDALVYTQLELLDRHVRIVNEITDVAERAAGYDDILKLMQHIHQGRQLPQRPLYIVMYEQSVADLRVAAARDESIRQSNLLVTSPSLLNRLCSFNADAMYLQAYRAATLIRCELVHHTALSAST